MSTQVGYSISNGQPENINITLYRLSKLYLGICKDTYTHTYRHTHTHTHRERERERVREREREREHPAPAFLIAGAIDVTTHTLFQVFKFSFRRF